MPSVRSRIFFLSTWLVILILISFYQYRRRFGTTPQRSLLLDHHLPFSCEGRWIHIYNLSDIYNENLVRNCSTFKKPEDLCPYMENGGMGRAFTYEPEIFPVKSEGSVWFNSWQSSLELYFHERLLQYPCIAPIESADMFYVPFYAGMDLSYSMTHRSVKKEAHYVELLTWLREQYFFTRRGGLDHFITLGRIALDFRRPRGDSWGTQMLLHPEFQNMVKLTVERDGGTPAFSKNEIAIPYPTYYHARSDRQVEDVVSWALQSHQRSVFVALAGIRKQRLGGIREKLMRDCESDGRCTLLICEGHEGVNQTDLDTRYPGNLPIAGHNLHTSCNYPSAPLDTFHRSQFCLQPPGDSPTRRSFFDALVAGCIPVIFKPTAAWTQYISFLPENGESFSILIPFSKLRKDNVIDMLTRIPQTQIVAMRAKIGELLPRILYAHVARKYPSTSGANGTVMENPDAFDLALVEVHNLMKRNEGK
ncbi:xyloglucan galactosyltransferase MUR3 [Marchantia polymorpha subsp. ruderalis]|uniref:Exostosin GT47 domain-containing protein n=3 Tax=Marchantia polymorpha TaxID=3197 RepID=A0AAF6AR66_MARPO|nr:hypothetical protein MARPO_0001s0074 [Marchantia polymorpha]BBM98936.1 hypothetical protein Mp_1g17340 [Marchantia polymorpha subsp. ruderalis]|eukprot:PTQ50012.1 hypothetical protein MARPO_0001s0074 [Marchantia polymorpha]